MKYLQQTSSHFAGARTRGIMRALKSIFAVAPVFVLSAVCALILFLPPQTHEVYRAMAEAIALTQEAAFREPIIALLSLLVLSLCLFLATMWLGRAVLRPSSVAKLTLLASVIAVLPMLGAALGCMSARVSDSALQPLRGILQESFARQLIIDEGWPAARATVAAQQFGENILFFNNILIDFFALFVAISISLFFLLYVFGRFSQRGPQLSSRVTALVVLATTAALVASFVKSPASLPQALTPIGILSLFFALVAFWIAYLRFLSRRIGWPFLSTLLCLALLISAFDCNDNHKVRRSPTLPASTVGVTDAVSQFKTWIKSRSDFDAYKGQRYPIYVVAAEGGGIYAAYHAATFLAETQDECANFAEHVFAISSVSGGSVGASVFAALLHQKEASDALAPSTVVRACTPERPKDPLLRAATTENPQPRFTITA
jgi:hypothetical protein